MFKTNPLQPPKKYIKDEDGGGKLKLNPAYKAWKEGEANSNGNTVVVNNSNNNHAAAATAIHCPVEETHYLPTAMAIAEDFPPYPEETQSQIQASEQYRLQNRRNTTRPSQAEELQRWQDETAPSAAEHELQRLRDENARLKTQQQHQQYQQQQQYQPVFSQSMTTHPTPAPPMRMMVPPTSARMTASFPPQQRTYSPPPPSYIPDQKSLYKICTDFLIQ